MKRQKRQARAQPAPSQSSAGLTAIAPDGLYRADQFIPSFIGIGRTTWFAGVKQGIFAQPAVRRHRLVLWNGRDVLAALERIRAGAFPERHQGRAG